MKFMNKQFWIGFIAGGIIVPPLAMAALLGAFYFFQDQLRAKAAENFEPPPLPMSQEADLDWLLQDIDGNEFNLADARGKVLFLNFWNPTCGNCLMELPIIQELYDRTRDDDIVFVTVSSTDDDVLYKVAAEYGLTFPIYVAKGKRPDVFSFNGVPFTYIIAPDGKIAFQHKGAARWDDDSTLKFMRDLKGGQS